MAKDEVRGRPFRLMTYNIRHGGIGRVEAIANVIAAASPDLVLLQEATQPSTVEKIADLTGMNDWRTYGRQSLGFISREKVAFCQWTRPLISRHAFVEVVPKGEQVRLFGVHLAAVHADWTERRRVFELRALLKSVERHKDRFHVLAGDFNTVAPGAELDVGSLPWRLRPLMWLSGGRVRWRTVQTVLDAGYVDGFRSMHPLDPGFTLPTPRPHIRLDYVFLPKREAGRLVSCAVVKTPDAVAIASDHFPVLAELNV